MSENRVRGRSKNNVKETIRNDPETNELEKDMIFNRRLQIKPEDKI